MNYQGPTDLCSDDVIKIVQLLGEIAGSTADLTNKRQTLMRELGKLINADYGTWVLGGELSDGFPSITAFLHYGFDSVGFAKYLEVQEDPLIEFLCGKFVEALVDKKVHVTRLSQQMTPPEQLEKSEIYPKLVDADLGCALLSGEETSEGQTSVLTYFRSIGKPLFSKRDARIAHILLSEVRWLHDTAWPDHPKESITALDPRQRTILSLLLQGMPKVDIAPLLEVSRKTLEDHIDGIFEAFKVHSQPELLNRFLIGNREYEI